jgi:Bifunctional DNA primase/polymerase, N-terminal
MTKVDFTAGALPYAQQLGWKILLLGPEWKLPFISKDDGGKGVHDASSNLEQIRKWGTLCPNGNIGVHCGMASGIVVIDVDPRNTGDISIRALSARGYVFPEGPRQRSGNGGWHLLFAYEPGFTSSKNRLGKGIDFQSDGKYIVLAPSWTRKSEQGPGGLYRWEVSPFDVPPPRMPVWMKSLLFPPPPPPRIFNTPAARPNLRPLIDAVLRAPNGEKNNILYWACRRAVDAGAFGQSEQAIFLNAALAIGFERKRALSTIKSAAGNEGRSA